MAPPALGLLFRSKSCRLRFFAACAECGASGRRVVVTQLRSLGPGVANAGHGTDGRGDAVEILGFTKIAGKENYITEVGNGWNFKVGRWMEDDVPNSKANLTLDAEMYGSFWGNFLKK